MDLWRGSLMYNRSYMSGIRYELVMMTHKYLRTSERRVPALKIYLTRSS